MLSAALTTQAQGLFIAKVASPSDEKINGKFVTLYNPTTDTIDFETTTYYLAKETNGGGSISNKKLIGKVAPSAYYVIAGISAFKDVYLSDPDCIAGCVTGNGNDSYMLYFNGDQTTGTLIDIYGEIGVDGLGSDWDYTDALATRSNGVNNGLTQWYKDEWIISKSLLAANANPWNNNQSSNSLYTLNDKKITINVYPNPCTQTVTIESEYQIKNISVISITGEICYQLNFTATNKVKIDSENFPNGIYMIEVVLSDDTVQVSRIIKR